MSEKTVKRPETETADLPESKAGPVPAPEAKVDPPTENKIPAAPIGLGRAVGRSGSFPCPLRIPVDGIEDPNDFPVAIFHLHPWDFGIVEELTRAGVAPLPNVVDALELTKQGVEVAVRIIDREKGWENLPRFDGSKWVYKAPTDEQVGTDDDLRVQLSYIGSFFNSVKSLSVALAFEKVTQTEKNSGTSSAVTTDEVAPYVANHPSFKTE